MVAVSMFVAQQQLEIIHRVLGGELCRALERFTNTLTEMPMGKRNASPREYAELREAKSLVSALKYPDPTEPVRSDELAWALKKIVESYRADAHDEWSLFFDRLAQMLDIDLLQQHPVPSDLNRRISNELVLFSINHGARFVPVAAAV